MIANRHLDLRQTLFVEYFVLRDHFVQEEQVGRQRIYLIGDERALSQERHPAMDVIPHRGRKRGAQWQYALPFPDGHIFTFFRFQRGRASRHRPPYARFAMAGDAPLLHIDLCALLGGAAARREFLSRRTDRDIQGADFFCGRSAPHAIGLRERGAPQEQHNRDKPKRAHWSRSRPWRSSTALRCCLAQALCNFARKARSSTGRPALASVAPARSRRCSAKESRSRFHPNSTDSRTGSAPWVVESP